MYRLRMVLAFAVVRAVFALALMLLRPVLTLHEAPRLVAAGLLVITTAAGLVFGFELWKRANWYREPGVRPGAWFTLAGAAMDAGLLLLVAAVVTSGGRASIVYPGAAVAKAAVLLAVVAVGVALIRQARYGRLAPEQLVASTVRLVGAGGAWLIADRVVPSIWRAEQAQQTGAAVLALLVIVIVGFSVARRLLPRRA